MAKKPKKWLIWVLAGIITLLALYYQRTTGPTYPVEVEMELDGSEQSFKLPRSHAGESDCEIKLELPESVTATLKYRRYPTNNNWTRIDFRCCQIQWFST